LKVPRDLSGEQLSRLLRKYGYVTTRQTGSHIRLTSTRMGSEHHITVPAHRNLKIGTLAGILGGVAEYLGISREEVSRNLFGS
jgi:predicted RNA binding protein YcfA (HicA-like mRNA interferase family)